MAISNQGYVGKTKTLSVGPIHLSLNKQTPIQMLIKKRIEETAEAIKEFSALKNKTVGVYASKTP